ncbi:hypothetical protein RKD29_007608 [Streptomyces tendae]|uniref:FCD domain-containing protein n=1 Tax=Streptomyces tendae TaxID=1932 RepID=UPI0038344C82
MDGTRKPGEQLITGTLGRDVEVSQTPLREALALRRPPEFLTEPAITVEELARSGERVDADADAFRLYWTSDACFRRLIAGRADNVFLEGAFYALSGHVQRFRLFMKAGHAHAGPAAAEHQRILDVLALGDPTAAAREIPSHVKATYERAQQLVQRLPLICRKTLVPEGAVDQGSPALVRLCERDRGRVVGVPVGQAIRELSGVLGGPGPVTAAPSATSADALAGAGATYTLNRFNAVCNGVERPSRPPAGAGRRVVASPWGVGAGRGLPLCREGLAVGRGRSG